MHSKPDGVPGGAGRTTGVDPWAAAWRHAIGTTVPAWTAKPDQGLTDDGPRQGLPLGGLGTGSVGRDHDGRFARWHLTPGKAHYTPVAGSWIALEAGGGAPAALLPAGTPTRPAGLADAMPDRPGVYEALFPVARSTYRPGTPVAGVTVTVTQWSPVLPHEEATSAWPAGYLQVTLASTAEEEQALTVAAAFELPVEDPLFHTPDPTRTVEGGSVAPAGGRAAAVAQLPEGRGSFALAVEAPGGDAVAARPLAGDDGYARLGGGLWAGLQELPAAAPAGVADRPGLAAAARVRLAPGQQRTVTFALAWDLPTVRFGPGLRTAWWRAHTREFGRSGAAAATIAATALARRAELAAKVDAWHGSLAAWLADAGAPAWLVAAALNELYVLVEGGTAWVAGPAENAGPPPAGEDVGGDGDTEEHFGVLESVDYGFYETLDVRYYSSFALLELWPRLERMVIGDFATFVTHDDPEPVEIEWTGAASVRTRPGAAPHDLGGPGGAPFRTPNEYLLQDADNWKDLNAKLVLEAARDARLLGDEQLARSVWPACRDAIHYLERFDRDGDGVPENDGVPDQTYDTWTMRGISAYCGDLWLAALTAGAWLATTAGDHDEARRLTALRDRAAPVVELALWRGDCYRFDDSGGPNSEDILADQLAGTWYLRVLGLPVTHPPERVRTALDTVLRHNLDGFCGGARGPVNGRSADGGAVVSDGEQPAEVWVGVAWALASLCLLEGRDPDAWRIGKALHDTLYAESGLWFRTPEAWTAENEFRAPVYHRPLAVWSLITALRVRQEAAEELEPPAADAARSTGPSTATARASARSSRR